MAWVPDNDRDSPSKACLLPLARVEEANEAQLPATTLSVRMVRAVVVTAQEASTVGSSSKCVNFHTKYPSHRDIGRRATITIFVIVGEGQLELMVVADGA